MWFFHLAVLFRLYSFARCCASFIVISEQIKMLMNLHGGHSLQGIQLLQLGAGRRTVRRCRARCVDLRGRYRIASSTPSTLAA